MDWMALRVEGLLEEAQKEAEEAVAEAEVINCGGIRIGGGLLFSPLGVFFI